MKQQISPVPPARPPLRTIDKAFFMRSYIGSFIAVFVLVLSGMTSFSSAPTDAVSRFASFFIWSILILAAGVYPIVTSLILLYRAWDSISDGNQSTTPGKAIGFMCIPLFNFYWIFRALWCFAKDYNAYSTRYKLGVNKMPQGLFLAASILFIPGTVIQILGSETMTPFFRVFIFAYITNYLCEGINSIARSMEAKADNTVVCSSSAQIG
jgi:hypothetical protein